MGTSADSSGDPSYRHHRQRADANGVSDRSTRSGDDRYGSGDSDGRYGSGAAENRSGSDDSGDGYRSDRGSSGGGTGDGYRSGRAGLRGGLIGLSLGDLSLFSTGR